MSRKIPVTSFERMVYLDQTVKDIVKEFKKNDPSNSFVSTPLEQTVGILDSDHMNDICSPQVSNVRLTNTIINHRQQFHELYPHNNVKLTCIVCKKAMSSNIGSKNLLYIFCAAMPYMPICDQCGKDMELLGFEGPLIL